MTGYQEAVTDPSYAEQLVCFTAPMVGNYGVAGSRDESSRPHARAALMREARGPEWTDWLREHGLVGISGLDTRSLVLRLREGGAMRAAAVAGATGEDEAVAAVGAQPAMAGRALVEAVSTAEPYVAADEGEVSVALVDYGAKRSIVRRLADAGAAVTVYPHDVDADSSHGTTASCSRTARAIRSRSAPRSPRSPSCSGAPQVLGICLGHQLLGLATGHETFKLPFGHRGANHPVVERRTGRVLVTSQNHGFAVSPTDDEGGDPRVALRRHRRGLRLPRAARALGAVPPRGRARARTTPGRSSAVGRRSVRRCLRGAISARSA